MKITKHTFYEMMNRIRLEQERLDSFYRKLEECLGDIDKLYEYINVDALIDMVGIQCGGNRKWLDHYIYDMNWGEIPAYAQIKNGIRLKLEDLHDLYNVLTYPQPWNLEFCYKK